MDFVWILMSVRKKAKTDEPAKEFTDEPDLRVIFEPDLQVKREKAGEDEECMVHSLILMLTSPVFRQMLTTTMGEQKRGEVRYCHTTKPTNTSRRVFS